MSIFKTQTALPLTPPQPRPSFWGWRMVAGGILISIIQSGVGSYGQGVILDPLRHAFGGSKGDISLALTFYFLTSGFAQILVGNQVNRHGPRAVMIAGALISGACYLVLGHITRLWQLYVLYSILALGWSATGLVPLNTIITNWFVKRRGLAMSLTMCGLSLGGFLIVPLTAWIILKWGLNLALPFLGLLYMVVVVPVTLLVLRANPADVGQIPDGGFSQRSSQPGPTTSDSAPPPPEAPLRRWTNLQAARTTAFWAIALGFMVAMCGQMAFLIHQISFLSEYMGVSHASFVVSTTALASVIGRLMLGGFVDRMNKRLVTITCMLLQGLMFLLLAHSHHMAVLYAGPFVFGLTMGNILMMQSLLTADCFGILSFATIFGGVSLFSMMGSAFGPWLAGVLFDLSGSYRTVFTIFSATTLLASAAVIFAKPPKAVV